MTVKRGVFRSLRSGQWTGYDCDGVGVKNHRQRFYYGYLVGEGQCSRVSQGCALCTHVYSSPKQAGRGAQCSAYSV